MSAFWFTSDQHFGHTNIIDFCERPFADTDDMDEALIENWNMLVCNDDIVYVLGDICMGKKEKTLEYVRRLPGTKILIPGNHDACWQGHRGYVDWCKKYRDAGFVDIIQSGAGQPEPLMVVGTTIVKMSHFPYAPDQHEAYREDRFSAYRPEDEGGWLIHGHVHNNHDAGQINGRQINVSVDVWSFRPVHMDELHELMEMP